MPNRDHHFVFVDFCLVILRDVQPLHFMFLFPDCLAQISGCLNFIMFSLYPLNMTLITGTSVVSDEKYRSCCKKACKKQRVYFLWMVSPSPGSPGRASPLRRGPG